MTRVFGEPVVSFLRSRQVDLVVDTKNLNIAGHGTPTVILAGRNKLALDAVKTVVNLEAAPGQASASAPAWQSLVAAAIGHGDTGLGAKAEAELIPANELWRHPVVLVPAPERALMSILTSAPASLSTVATNPGLSFVTGEEDAYVRPASWARTRSTDLPLRPLVDGVRIRDWQAQTGPQVLIFPYTDSGHPVLSAALIRELWPQRTVLASTLYFGNFKRERGLNWYEYAFLSRSRMGAARLTYPLVTDYAHFLVLPAGAPYLLDHSAPTAILSSPSDEDVVALNASTSWFWMKRTFFLKGHDDPEQDFIELDATKARSIPLMTGVRPEVARRLLTIATRPSPLLQTPDTPNIQRLEGTRTRSLDALAAAISAQEELDWEVYWLYGLVDKDLTFRAEDLPNLALGQRAFEIALARSRGGAVETTWFARHGSTPITELPGHWSTEYCELVERRLQAIARSPTIALLEKPEHKRRWAAESWGKQYERALRNWLLDRLEDRSYWYAVGPDGGDEPLVRTVRTLGSAVERDPEFVQVARMWSADALGTPDADVTTIVGRLIDDEHVPYLAAYRYKGKGLTKRADWERTWDLQRQEDRIAAEVGQDIGHPAVREAIRTQLGSVPVPPRYGPPDYVRASYWTARGKLDVPKERFISYPGAARDADGSLTLGWAGWNAVDRAHVLAEVVNARRDEDGWGGERITPLLAGLAEQLPWVAQWHPDVDPRFGVAPADIYGGFLAELRGLLQLTVEDLTGWRPTGRLDVSPLPRVRAPSAARSAVPRTARPTGEPIVSRSRSTLSVDKHAEAVLWLLPADR